MAEPDSPKAGLALCHPWPLSQMSPSWLVVQWSFRAGAPEAGITCLGATRGWPVVAQAIDALTVRDTVRYAAVTSESDDPISLPAVAPSPGEEISATTSGAKPASTSAGGWPET